MKRRTLQWNVIPDEGGQALTEFVIVIPIILLFFFAMVQYFSIVQATQLGNYAAFEAARVYSVRESVDDTDAVSKATIAAAIAMSPVARPAAGEIGGSYLSSLQNLGNDVTTFLNSIIPGAGNIVVGYPMARYVRYNSDLLGGSVNCSLASFNSTSPTQVVVTINYPQPLYIPGLAELWRFVGGASTSNNIYAGTQPLAAGLTGVPKYLLPIYAGQMPGQDYLNDLSQYDSGVASSLSSDESSILSDLPVVLLPYVNIQSECAIGYCNWSGIPREPDTIADSEGSGTNDAMQQLQQTQKDKQTYSNELVTVEQDCQNMTNAYQQYLTAKQNYDQSTNSDNLTALKNAEQAYSGYYVDYGTDGTSLTNAMNQLNTDLSNLPSVPGSTPSQSGGNSGAFNQQSSQGSQSAPSVGGINCPCTCPSPPLSTD
ncbi:MAG TPA: TadE family protein [Verrucomicrobiae bacterium]|jgi:Flp pilus assembly protein TadG